MSQDQKVPITVVVARVEHPGFWCLGGTEYIDGEGKTHKTLRGKSGVFFPVGSTDIEVTPDELAALRAEEAKQVPILNPENGKQIGSRPALPIKIIEYSSAEMALRLAAAAEKDARDADAVAEKAMLEAQQKTEAAKRLRSDATSANEKPDPAKGRR
jgi:hypothetical protein